MRTSLLALLVLFTALLFLGKPFPRAPFVFFALLTAFGIAIRNGRRAATAPPASP